MVIQSFCLLDGLLGLHLAFLAFCRTSIAMSARKPRRLEPLIAVVLLSRDGSPLLLHLPYSFAHPRLNSSDSVSCLSEPICSSRRNSRCLGFPGDICSREALLA